MPRRYRVLPAALATYSASGNGLLGGSQLGELPYFKLTARHDPYH